jgi:hypothetical protein
MKRTRESVLTAERRQLAIVKKALGVALELAYDLHRDIPYGDECNVDRLAREVKELVTDAGARVRALKSLQGMIDPATGEPFYPVLVCVYEGTLDADAHPKISRSRKRAPRDSKKNSGTA